MEVMDLIDLLRTTPLALTPHQGLIHLAPPDVDAVIPGHPLNVVEVVDEVVEEDQEEDTPHLVPYSHRVDWISHSTALQTPKEVNPLNLKMLARTPMHRRTLRPQRQTSL